jgi:tRNA pseudouridine55 synthase
MGLLYVDKPAGITSHDVVGTVRRAARTKRVGHAGTLDPFATGLLVVAVGACTRLLPYVAGEPKVYDALIRFGTETNTDDRTGAVVREASLPMLDALDGALKSLTGVIPQVPPQFSAKHVDGQRAYTVARRGEEVVLAPVSVTVHAWDLLEQHAESIRVRITCAGGTYVRALARDLGRALHSAAHCAELRRVASGPAHVDFAVPFAALAPGAIADGRIPLRSPVPLLDQVVLESLDDDGLTALSHGRSVAATQPGARAALMRDDTVVGIAERVVDPMHGDRWQPRVVLLGDAA